jgi:hypothetical protein
VLTGKDFRDLAKKPQKFFQKRVDRERENEYIGKCAVEGNELTSAPNLDKLIV